MKELLEELRKIVLKQEEADTIDSKEYDEMEDETGLNEEEGQSFTVAGGTLPTPALKTVGTLRNPAKQANQDALGKEEEPEEEIAQPTSATTGGLSPNHYVNQAKTGV